MSLRDIHESWQVAGLEGDVEILVDRWGIPHIYGGSAADAYLAQGFNAARERLWQVDTWRRCGLGLMSEALGPEYLERDRAARLFAFRGDIEEEWAAYGPTAKTALTRFAAGLNAFIQMTRANPELLPREFEQLGYEPGTWAPEDVLRVRSNGRHHNAQSELTRALVVRDYGPAVERLRAKLEPECELLPPEGLDLDALSPDLLRAYRLATAPFRPCSDDVAREPQVASVWGSNNWALSGSRTASGRPILANDPHRTLTFPSLRYACHLSAPELEMIGAGEPSVPGVAIGHNGSIAFGVTTFPGDQEDLYVYELGPDGESYRYQGSWEAFRVERESVSVRGREAPEEIELRFTRHGPVVAVDPEKRVALAVRAAWLEPGMAPYLGSLGLLGASNWPEFSAAAEAWGYPADNLVYADVEGTIAWKPAGRLPRRRGWNGLFPVPGDGSYEWEGAHEAGALPESVDPPCGWVASANQRNLPIERLEQIEVGREWMSPYRFDRIAEVLARASGVTPEDCLELQTDCVSIAARQVIAAIAAIEGESPDAVWALGLLRRWDCSLAADSAPAALFELWLRAHLAPALIRRVIAEHVPPEQVDGAQEAVLPAGAALTDPRPLIELLERPDEFFASAGHSKLAEVVETTLAAAVADLERRLGPDRGAWRWGSLHAAQLSHPAASLLSRLEPEQLSTSKAARGGGIDTVGNTAYSSLDFAQTDGSSWRTILTSSTTRRSGPATVPCPCCSRARRSSRRPAGASCFGPERRRPAVTG
jgi:penicillin amidase